MRPRVFVVQEPLAKSASGVGTRPAFDITPAKRFGELVYLLDWSDAKFDEPDGVLAKLHDRLQDISKEDYLLMTGSPTVFATAAIVAADYLDIINLLMWERSLNGGRGDYKVITLNLGGYADTVQPLHSPSLRRVGHQ